MIQYQKFYVQKTSFAFDGTLIAFGLARVLQELLDKQGDEGEITIEDCATYYELRLSEPLSLETLLQQSSTLIPRPALETDKTTLPAGIRKEKYEELRDKAAAFFNTAKDMRAGLEVPPREWDIYRALNPSSLAGYNSLMIAWYTVRAAPEALLILFDLFASFPNELERAIDAWKTLDKRNGWKISAGTTRQQLYNPDSGKGQNKAKADGLSIANLDGFWLCEWLKALGFYEVALTKLMRSTKDRKTIVLAPKRLTFDQHQSIMTTFVDSIRASESSIRFDILAALRYTRALLNNLLDQQDEMVLQNVGSIKDRLVGGFYTAFYKDMGSALATMNLSFMALPAWVQVNSQADIVMHLELLENFDAFVLQFDEGRAEDTKLLKALRDFISGDSLPAFFNFSNAFPSYLMGRRELNQYARQFSIEFIERILVTTDKALSSILENAGFQNIAYAIRQATVVAQYKKKQGDKRYIVHYGLGQELARLSRYPGEFIAALSEFLYKYNAENAMVMEKKSAPYRRSVQTADIDEILRLIDDFGSKTVASLLIAYGHARMSRDKEGVGEFMEGDE